MNIVPTDNETYFYAKPRRPDDTLDPADRTKPNKQPVVDETVLRLVGVRG